MADMRNNNREKFAITAHDTLFHVELYKNSDNRVSFLIETDMDARGPERFLIKYTLKFPNIKRSITGVVPRADRSLDANRRAYEWEYYLYFSRSHLNGETLPDNFDMKLIIIDTFCKIER